MSEAFNITIDARLNFDGSTGGREQFVASLISALGRLTDGPEHYSILVHPDDVSSLKALRGPNQRFICGETDWKSQLKSALGPLRRPIVNAVRAMRSGQSTIKPTPREPKLHLDESNGFYESFGGHVMHFPHQYFARCAIPTIFNPHDLQHCHFPEFFDSVELKERDFFYRAACCEATAVAAESGYARRDVIAQYGVNPEKVFAILRGAPTDFYAPVTPPLIESARGNLNLPPKFVFYPAQTWKHKNHLRLLEALVILRDRHQLVINLVCTGRKNEYWPVIEGFIRGHQLESQTHFLGFVTADELRAIYHMTEFLVFPSLFEGGGFPLMEAFREGTAVTCADSSSLPDYGGDAVLLFDPKSPESIANAMYKLATDEPLRADLSRRGRLRAASFTWEKTAKSYRALYRKLANRNLAEEDRALLAGE